MIQKTHKNYEALWEELYRRMAVVLDKYGSSYNLRVGEGDYWIIDEPYGFDQHNVYFHKFKMFDPKVVKELQDLLKQFSGWEIFVTAYIDPEGESWPNMGLIIREHEIIDGLQRQYFPAEYQSIQYEGSRVGTDKD
jgi:hypothetical protein